jgi:hypothetical protein
MEWLMCPNDQEFGDDFDDPRKSREASLTRCGD